METKQQPKKIGIFGGTFNPPHIGHILSAEAAAKKLDVDLLLLIPTGLPPHKELPEQTPTAEDRLEMLRLATDGMKNTEILDWELKRAGKSYTIDTVHALQAEYPDGEFYLMMGTDMFQSLESWREYEALLSLVHLVVFNRGEKEETERNRAYAQKLKEQYGADIICMREKPTVISSTQLRAAVKEGTWHPFVSPAVYGYILRRQLYGIKRDLHRLSIEELRAVACSFLRAKRVPHVMGTERAAIALAERWGASKEDAQVAALLHDCTKRLTMEEQLKLCEKYDIVLDDLEQKALKLLHALTGAEVAREVCGVSDAVYSAIRWHTTGKADMSLLEKIIYMADFIEENRDFPGVEPLRKLAFEDLDRAMLLGFEMTIEEMNEMGNPIHFRTLEARDWLKGKRHEC
ncbi:MAG: nicotinate (nicotinamide) nucleotide adenylyltransferase [Oscillospiraceae bacterium]|nr:nicotinate (nicotinamide) nucleotide adenylyltransferase [Oscillospiraceae bacterium]